MHNDKIIGYCLTYPSKAISTTKKITTYKTVTQDKSYDDLFDEITLTAYASSLCTDPDYKKVGSFLLDKLSNYFKSIGMTKLYTTVESPTFKNNYQAFAGLDSDVCQLGDQPPDLPIAMLRPYDQCVVGDQYYDANMKLIKYYETNGFKISKNLYESSHCDGLTDKYMFYNVLYRELV